MAPQFTQFSIGECIGSLAPMGEAFVLHVWFFKFLPRCRHAGFRPPLVVGIKVMRCAIFRHGELQQMLLFSLTAVVFFKITEITRLGASVTFRAGRYLSNRCPAGKRNLTFRSIRFPKRLEGWEEKGKERAPRKGEVHRNRSVTQPYHCWLHQIDSHRIWLKSGFCARCFVHAP